MLHPDAPPGLRRWRGAILLIGLIAVTPGCYRLQGSDGGAQAAFSGPRQIDPTDVVLPQGYRIEVVATGLTFPTDLAFDDQNRPHVTEAGYSYGEVFTTPRLLRIESDGSLVEIARGQSGEQSNGPWNGVAFHEGAFFVAEGGVRQGGRILRISSDGTITPLIEDLPSVGDHHTNGPVIGPDGMLYFAIGTATNSGVVGVDNYKYGWLERHPEFHDIPARDITLTGRNFTTPNPLTDDPDDEATTGAYVPFGTRTQEGQVIPGQMPANGTVLRIAPDGGEPELVAWGLRNPYSLAFDATGRLFVSENSFDVRGSRPVWGTGDVLWQIDLENPGTWHGWPDFHAGRPLTDEGYYQPPGESAPQFLLAEHPNDPPHPAAILPVHASTNHFDFSPSEGFGHVGQAFIASFGDMAPTVGKVLAPVGFNVIRVDPGTGAIHAFAINRGETNGPASLLNHGGLERPISVRFDNTGEALYVVDFGVLTVEEGKSVPRRGTGVIWRITRTGEEGR